MKTTLFQRTEDGGKTTLVGCQFSDVSGRRTGKISRNLMIFTLVELLVVIAIIGVLASMLLPALSRARAAAQSITCVSNQKQLGAGFAFYTDSYNQILPEIYDASTVMWDQKLVVGEFAYNSSFICPSVKAAVDWSYVNAAYAQSHPNDNIFFYPNFGMTKWYKWPRGTGANAMSASTTSNVSRAKKPEATGLTVDSYYSATRQAYYYVDDYYYTTMTCGIDARHGGAVNCLMLDGHLESVQTGVRMPIPYSTLSNPYMHPFFQRPASTDTNPLPYRGTFWIP